MADANTIIRQLGQQIAQMIIDKTVVEVELAETQAKLAGAEVPDEPEEAK